MNDHLEPLRVECDRFAAAITGADEGAPVPCCPAWDLRELVSHLGRVQRFWAGVIRRGADVDPERPGDDVRPGAGDDLVAWFRSGAADLLAAVAEAPADRPAWTWWAAPRTAGAIARHQVQEAAVHRWDADTAAGRTPAPVDAGAAADAVEEFLSAALPDIHGDDPWPGSDGVVELVATDVAGATRWVVLGGERPVPAPDRPPSVTVSVAGTASDLLLLLYRRVPLEGLAVTGDEGFATAFADWLAVE